VIYLFHGSDVGKVRAKAFAWIAAARAKQPEAHYVRIGASELTPSSLFEAASMQGLFFTKTLVLIDDPFSLVEAGEVLLDHLDLLVASENPIAILSPKLLAARAKNLETKAEKVFVVDLTAKKEGRGFNTALVNALASRNAHELWKEIQKAGRAGDAAEMTHGLLHWKARDLLEKGSRMWTPSEARKLSRDLIELLSDSRNGDLPLSLALERFALSV
jgi:hypothetical protein